MRMGKLSRAGDTVIAKEVIKEGFTKVVLKHLKEGREVSHMTIWRNTVSRVETAKAEAGERGVLGM